jgi:ATP-dependent DNA helicase DinG
VLAEADKRQIQACYRQWLAARELNPRVGQRQMIAEVARVLARSRHGSAPRDEVIAAIEAGTGTGKTVAYLLPALVLAQSLRRHLVVSTATVVLQEQLVHKDLPDLLEHTALDFDYVLAKGRGRYVCKAKLVAAGEQGAGDTVGLAFYPDEHAPVQDDAARMLRQKLLGALEAGSWDGDRDHWEGHIVNTDWQPLTSDHMQCTGRRCVYVNECPYFASREGLEGADCVVANHDLVLADLALGGGVILPPPEETLYIFDEAHQLAEKAQQHFGHRVRLSATRSWLDQMIKGLPTLMRELAADALCTGLLQQCAPLLAALRDAVDDCRQSCLHLLEQLPNVVGEEITERFALGELPPVLAEHAHAIGFDADKLAQLFDTLTGRLDDIISGEVIGVQVDSPEQWFAVLGQITSRLTTVSGLAAAYNPAMLDPESPQARWLSARRQMAAVEVELCALPVLPRRLLDEMLWQRCAAAILTSASITALGRFERFIDETGIPAQSRCCLLPSPFNHFEAACLSVPAAALDPSAGEAYTAMLGEQMPDLIDEGSGTLVLFSARRQMQAVYEGLDGVLRRTVLLQDHYGKQEILQRHRDAVDRGESSVIFGLASFAEGVDLPGDYCTHVVITRLPFAVPDDPVEATLSEWVRSQGGQPFRDVTLPDAARRLVQSSGRLLRTEQDRGRITVLDARLITRRYGQQILQSLPNYRLETS